MPGFVATAEAAAELEKIEGVELSDLGEKACALFKLEKGAKLVSEDSLRQVLGCHYDHTVKGMQSVRETKRVEGRST